MSNEYKDWLNDQKEQNKVIFNQLRNGKHPFVSLEEQEFFIHCINDFGIDGLIIQQSHVSNGFYLGVNDATINKWMEKDSMNIRDCHKCVYEVGCNGDPVRCTSYKRDAPDGGCY